jgi:PPK2 family polyphosphate:nucleotide phosphotransferase
MRLDTISTEAPKHTDKQKTKQKTIKILKQLEQLQELLYMNKKNSVLVIIQGMDAAGKDGAIKSIFTGINPQGCNVSSFKEPTPEELAHDFLWRIHQHTPPKGMIHIFNRSQYEDVLITRVHGLIDDSEAKRRYRDINNFEDLLSDEGTIIFKFYLHVSKEEQARRLKERLSNPAKKWKYSKSDFKERKFWDKYTRVYEDMLKNCNDRHKWVIVPSDQNWYKEYTIAHEIVARLEALKMT